ncbi:hypothetical protein JCM3765_000593 [Sporobolomyces pararoseus]
MVEPPELPITSSSTATSTTLTTAQYSSLNHEGGKSNGGNSHHHKRHRSTRRSGGGGGGIGGLDRVRELSGAILKRPAAYLTLIGLTVAIIVLVNNNNNNNNNNRQSSPGGADRTTRDSNYFADGFERLSKGWRTSSSSKRPLSNDDGEWGCNPFEQNGRLKVDGPSTSWIPFDSRCKPSNLMKSLYKPLGDNSPLIPDPTKSPNGREFLPWFRNRTVLLHGDSIDRFHLKDFCEFVGGKLELITPEHQASPQMWKKPGVVDQERREWEKKWSERPREGQELTNPWICDVQEYGTTLINVFTWGLQGAEEFFQMERWYYPPATWVDRMDHITLPLLPRLAKYLDRPQIENPDLIILNSGYWDLRKYTEEDFTAAGYPSRPYPEDSSIPYNSLSFEREQTWEREARKAIKHAAKSFRGKEGKTKDGPVLLWRSLHHPPRHNYAPFPRVFQLDSLARKVISDLKLSSSSSSSSSSSVSSPSPPLSSLDEFPDREDLGLTHRLRIDESGKLMLGQEHLFRDLLHPLPVPGSWIWGDIMLYELKRAVEGVDR